ncbi:hypothetical protein ACN27F_23470 [Solwaraspora sp. WMMB335]
MGLPAPVRDRVLVVPVSNGEISVHLANRGSNPNGERIGAAQVRLSCTAT